MKIIKILLIIMGILMIVPMIVGMWIYVLDIYLFTVKQAIMSIGLAFIGGIEITCALSLTGSNK